MERGSGGRGSVGMYVHVPYRSMPSGCNVQTTAETEHSTGHVEYIFVQHDNMLV